MVRLIEYLAAGVVDSSGDIVSSGTVTFYDAGTTTLRTVYEDYELSTPHSNPATLDAAGRLFAWADRRVKIVVADSSGTAVKTIDDIGGISDGEVLNADIADGTIEKDKLNAESLNSVRFGDVSAVSSNTTITDGDGVGFVRATGGSSGITVTLPTAAANANRLLVVKKIDSAAGVVTVDGEEDETIDGETTFILPVEYATATFRCNGISWDVVESFKCSVAAIFRSDDQVSLSTGTTTIMDFEIEVIDSHSAVTTGASWVFTAPRAGRYMVTGTCLLTSNAGWEATERFTMYLFKEGSQYTRMGDFVAEASNTLSVQAWGSTLVDLASGDEINIRLNQDSDGTIATTVTATENQITIHSVD